MISLIRRSRRGSGMVIALFVLMLLFALGMSFLSVASSSIITSKRDIMRTRALACAEAGVERAVDFIMSGGPNGEPYGEWTTIHADPSNPDVHTGDTMYTDNLGTGETYSLCVRKVDAGSTNARFIITSIGKVEYGSLSVNKTIKVVVFFRKEDVNVWNNVIFAGSGLNGKAIQGNIIARGSVHMLGDGEEYKDVDNDGHWDSTEPLIDTNGNGQWDTGEDYTDVDMDGHWDKEEPYIDANGDGTRTPVTLASEISTYASGNMNFGNNYESMTAALKTSLPALETTTFGGQNVETLYAKLRVKHGQIKVGGSATIGAQNSTTNSWKETMDGCYVTDSFIDNSGGVPSSSIFSDNGYNNGYDLGDGLVKMPYITSLDGSYSHLDWLRDNGLQITPPGGILTLTPGTTYTKFDGVDFASSTNAIELKADGTMNIKGIVYIDGQILLGNKNIGTIRYSGNGSLVATGNIAIEGNVLPLTKFAQKDDGTDGDVLGLITPGSMSVGVGNSQLTLALAMYAQNQIVGGKQCEIAGTMVSSYYNMVQVPHIFQVPELADHLPPGMPAKDPIWIKSISMESWQEM